MREFVDEPDENGEVTRKINHKNRFFFETKTEAAWFASTAEQREEQGLKLRKNKGKPIAKMQ